MFWIYAIGLLALTAIALAWPWFKQGQTNTDNRAAMNKQLRQEQLQQLDKQLSDAQIDDENYAQLKLELDKRLLDDITEESHTQNHSAPYWLLTSILILVSLISIATYQHLGAGKEQQLAADFKAVFPQQSTDTAHALQVFEALHQHGLPATSASLDWLLMSAQGYMSVQHYRKAAIVYDDIISVANDAPYLLANAAQAHYLANNRQLNDIANTYLQHALALNPRQQNALGFAGMIAFEEGNYSTAVSHWQTIVDSLPPQELSNSPLVGALEEAKRRGGIQVKPTSQLSAKSDNNSPQIQVMVSIADQIQAPSNATVFVFARAINGPPVPLAVKRLRVSDLPTTITLTKNDAMSPQFSLSSATQVNIKARISFSGHAIAQAGDIESNVVPLDLTKDELRAELVIAAPLN